MGATYAGQQALRSGATAVISEGVVSAGAVLRELRRNM